MILRKVYIFLFLASLMGCRINYSSRFNWKSSPPDFILIVNNLEFIEIFDDNIDSLSDYIGQNTNIGIYDNKLSPYLVNFNLLNIYENKFISNIVPTLFSIDSTFLEYREELKNINHASFLSRKKYKNKTDATTVYQIYMDKDGGSNGIENFHILSIQELN